MARRPRRTASTQLVPRPEAMSFGGGLEGAERTSSETMRWSPSRLSPDQIINGINGNGFFGAKWEADFRGRDVVTNDGYAQGVVRAHRDSIAGTQYRLNAQPNWTVLQTEVSRAFDEEWAEEYKNAVEERFNLIADADPCWLDASRVLTFTGLVRMAIAGFVYTGEVLATAEWIRQNDRPFSTAIQIVAPIRLSNPYGAIDSATLRNGVVKDSWGKPVAYNIRDAYPTEFYMGTKPWHWTTVPAEKPWGRRQVIHVKDPIQPAQTRGISDLVAVLKQMRMTKKFQDIVLQNSVINASYAATIESELPSDVVAAMMGGPSAADPAATFMNFIGTYLVGLNAYLEQANGVAVDGAKLPHLFPGTKLNARPLGTPGGVGTDFEVSLLRHIAAGIGISYEEMANDFSRTNYSSARASMQKTWVAMQGKKKFVADRFANEVYTLWLEEELNAGNLPMPRNYTGAVLYRQNGTANPIVKAALASCDWVGAARGQIDELKETQAALLRINGGLSTWEAEIAKQGGDYRKVFRQRARENQLAGSLGLDFSLAAQKSGAASGQQVMQEAGGETP
jgi:lambda family phage portal protein